MILRLDMFETGVNIFSFVDFIRRMVGYLFRRSPFLFLLRNYEASAFNIPPPES